MMELPSPVEITKQRDLLYTAILLDGTKNPPCVRFGRKDKTGLEMNYPPASISWSGSAVKPTRTFNFLSEHFRDKGQVSEIEVRVFKLPGLKMDASIPGLVNASGKEQNLEQQCAQRVDEFLYPEKYATLGVFS